MPIWEKHRSVLNEPSLLLKVKKQLLLGPPVLMFKGNIKNTCSSRILCQVLPSRSFKSLPLAKFPGNIPRPERAGVQGERSPQQGRGGVRRQLPCRLLSQVSLAHYNGHHCETRRGAVARGVLEEEGTRCCTWEPSPRDALPTEEVLVTDGAGGSPQDVGCL